MVTCGRKDQDALSVFYLYVLYTYPYCLVFGRERTKEVAEVTSHIYIPFLHNAEVPSESSQSTVYHTGLDPFGLAEEYHINIKEDSASRFAQQCCRHSSRDIREQNPLKQPASTSPPRSRGVSS